MNHTLHKTISILDKTEKSRFYTFILMNIFISLIDIASLSLLVLLIGFYTQGVAYPGIMLKLQWLFKPNSPLPILLLALLFVFKNIIAYFVFVAQYNYVYKVASNISEKNLLRYLNGNYTDYVHTDSSIRVRQILHQPVEFCHYVLVGVQQVITESVLLFFTVLMVMIFNAGLFLLLIVALAPPVIIISWLAKRRLRSVRTELKGNSEKTLQYLQEALSGYVESNVYERKTFFTDRYTGYQRKMFQNLSNVQTMQGLPSRLLEVFAVLGLLILIMLSKSIGNSSAKEIINIGAFMIAAYKLIPGIVKISNISGQIKAYDYTINDLIHKEDNSDQNKERKENVRLRSVSFKNISFRYDTHQILSNFNCDLNKGDITGIFAPVGKGKTTIANLILGFLSQEHGALLINGAVTSTNERQQYWQRISYVQQRPFLIHDTIAANITLADEAVINDQLIEVVNIVGLDILADRSAKGLNTLITEDGKNISGGQRQRIAIARALYKDADLIILDEPFSEMDAQSELRILEYLKLLSQSGKMIILITHKKEHLSFCTKTFIIE